MGKKKKHNKKNKKQNKTFNSDEAEILVDVSNCGEEEKESLMKEKEEHDVLLELRMRSRSLLQCIEGVAPDGSPFVVDSLCDKEKKSNTNEEKKLLKHPLVSLLQSIFSLTKKLILIQRALHLKNSANGEDNNVKESKERDNRDSPETWRIFSNWLEKCQINPVTKKFPIEIRKSENTKAGYGIYATRDIGYNELILEIPTSAMISLHWDHLSIKAENENDNLVIPKPPPFDSNLINSPIKNVGLEQLSLISFLVNEKWKGQKSQLYPYLNCLPETYSTPLYWSFEGIQCLKTTSQLKRAVALIAITMLDYLRVRDQLEQFHKEKKNSSIIPSTYEFSYELFRWATATVHTRQNMIPFLVSKMNEDNKKEEIVKETLALVPLWDLINHEDSENSCLSEVIFLGKDDDKNGLLDNNKKEGLLICRTPVKSKSSSDKFDICFNRGDEIKMYYGDRSNAQLLFQSGFVNCDYDILESKSRIAAGKLEALETNNNEDDSIHLKKSIVNLNRSDTAVLRLTLPFQNCDSPLHRIREMVAARFGFKLYVNQNCFHDGIACAQIASRHLSPVKDNNFESTTPMHDESISETTIMAEFLLSHKDPCPIKLKRAILLCIADRADLNNLLRNMEMYDDKKEISTKMKNMDLLYLKKKHYDFVEEIVRFYVNKNNNYPNKLDNVIQKIHVQGSNDIWMSLEKSMDLSRDLAACELMTLTKWFDSFSKQYTCNKSHAENKC